jgi:hypothetical protein
MKKRNLALFVLLVPQIAMAQVAITEIMFDPSGVDSGHEWVEVYNEGTSSIPLSTWKLYEGNANHKIIAASGDSMLAPVAYAVIASNAAKFRNDYPNFAGALFHSAISLDNGGETITLRDRSLTDVDAVSYDSSLGGVGDGNSLQRIPGDTGNFMPRIPSPGAAMSLTAVANKITPVTPTTKISAKSTQKTAVSSGVKSQPSVRATNDAGNMAVVTSQTAAATTPGIDSYWFFALAAVILLAIATIAGSRHFKKSEWEIIEESPEDV